MLDLAIHQDEGPIALADISQRQGISLSYLEQLFARLRKQNLVLSVRGPGGGYSLRHEASDIYVSQVISAVDEKVDTTKCGGAHNCQHNEQCLTHDLWHELSNKIREYLGQVSLQDLMDKRDVQQIAERQEQRAPSVSANSLSVH
jgi:Rrf2 family iron-sulfur cluster assembly transcriptional regulator